MTTGIQAGSDASDVRVSYVAETAWGTTPTSPGFTNLRLTSETIQPVKETLRSDELEPSGNVTDEIQVGRAVTGALNFELSYGTFDPLLESAFYSSFVTNVMVNGVAGTSFTIEKRALLPDASYGYQRFVGMVANGITLNVTAKQKITGSIDFVGKFGGYATTTLSGATYAAANQNAIMSASSQFASFNVNGLSPNPKIRSLTLRTTRNLRQQAEAGNIDLAGIGKGRFEASGTVEAYFENGLLYNAYLNHTDLGMSFVLGSTSGQRYLWNIPTLKLNGQPGVNAGGNDQDLMLTPGWMGILDRTTSPVIGGTVKLTRAY